MSTIYDIAKRTGLSASTVARALSGNGYCSKQAKEVVFKAAKEMNYVPVQAAKILKSKITKKVMFCIPDIFNPFYFGMIRGVNQVLEKYGYYTILVYTEHNRNRELNMIEALKERFVDGMIMVSFDFNEKMIAAMAESGLPVVITNLYESRNASASFDCVYVDHVRATNLAASHLIENGHRNIAYLGGSVKEQTGAERLKGYREALEAAGIGYNPALVIQSDYTRVGGEREFGKFIKREGAGAVTALVAANDLMGVGSLTYCMENGIRVPRDLSIVTLDNTEYCKCTYPRLSSVDMMQKQIGQNAAQALMERIQDGREYNKVVRLEPQLKNRDSVLNRADV